MRSVGAGFLRKLMLAEVVTASPTGPTARQNRDEGGEIVDKNWTGPETIHTPGW